MRDCFNPALPASREPLSVFRGNPLDLFFDEFMLIIQALKTHTGDVLIRRPAPHLVLL
jgi:hypothetical protein